MLCFLSFVQLVELLARFFMSSPNTPVSTDPVVTVTAPQSDELARQFLKLISRIVQQSSPKDSDDDEDEEFLLPKDTLRPDIGAAAILLARGIEAAPDLMCQWIIASPLVVIETRREDQVEAISAALHLCVLDRRNSAAYADQFRRPKLKSTRALRIVRDGTERSHKPDNGNDQVLTAIAEGRSVVGISQIPERYLPRDLVRGVDFHLKLSDLDGSALSLLIETVTGAETSQTIEPELIRAATMSDLRLAIRPNDKPETCMARLQAIVKAKQANTPKGPRLEELAGYSAAKTWGLDLARDINAYKSGHLQWSDIDRGLLLDGPPGVGKTQFAAALARSARVPLITTSVAQWNSATYLSGTLQAIRKCFDDAARASPSILFIDELDGISDRSRLQGEYVEYWSQIVNLLLELLSGAEDCPGIVVIGATNHAERIDPAIRRAGRLDRTIKIDSPDTEDLVEIFRYYLKADLTGADLKPLALAARGRTGADIEAYVRRARSKARRDGRPLSIEDVKSEIGAGTPSLSPRLREVVCIHEAAHVVVGAALEQAFADTAWVANDGGRTSVYVPPEHLTTLNGLENEITTLLSGRTAEMLLLGDGETTSGAGGGDDSDLARATKTAFDIEIRFGFGESGLLRLPENAIAALMLDRTVQAAVKRRLNTCQERAERLIQLHRTAIRTIADTLEQHGYIDRVAISAILKRNGISSMTE